MSLGHSRFHTRMRAASRARILTTFFVAHGTPSRYAAHHGADLGLNQAADDVLARCTHQNCSSPRCSAASHAHERASSRRTSRRSARAIELFRARALSVLLLTAARVVQPSRRDPAASSQIACVNVRLVPSRGRRLTSYGHDRPAPARPAGLAVPLPRQDPNDIATVLYDCAGYLLDHGDVIEDGNTIGYRPWRCHFDMARVESRAPRVDVERRLIAIVVLVLGLALGIVVPFFWPSPLPVLLGAALLVARRLPGQARRAGRGGDRRRRAARRLPRPGQRLPQPPGDRVDGARGRAAAARRGRPRRHQCGQRAARPQAGDGRPCVGVATARRRPHAPGVARPARWC